MQAQATQEGKRSLVKGFTTVDGGGEALVSSPCGRRFPGHSGGSSLRKGLDYALVGGTLVRV